MKLMWIQSHFLTSKIRRGLCAIALAVGMLSSYAATASAQAAYGSYVGIGGSLGLTDGADNEDSAGGAVIAARYALLEIPVSLRAQILISDATAVVPTVSYDFPIDWYTDVYIGAGIAIQNSDTNTSPVGNQTSFAIQPGIDHRIPGSRLVLFGNAIIAFDAYREGGGTAASLQGGVGLRF
jgi:hypothetical protein